MTTNHERTASNVREVAAKGQRRQQYSIVCMYALASIHTHIPTGLARQRLTGHVGYIRSLGAPSDECMGFSAEMEYIFRIPLRFGTV